MGPTPAEKEFNEKARELIEIYDRKKRNGKGNLKDYFIRELGIGDYALKYMMEKRKTKWCIYRLRRQVRYQKMKIYNEAKKIKADCDQIYRQTFRGKLTAYSEAAKAIDPESGLNEAQIEKIIDILTDKKYRRWGTRAIDTELAATVTDNTELAAIATDKKKTNTQVLSTIIDLDMAISKQVKDHAETRREALKNLYTSSPGFSANTAWTALGSAMSVLMLPSYLIGYAVAAH